MYSIEYERFVDINSRWNIAFFGTHNDERDKETKKYLCSSADNSYLIEYDLDELCLLIDNKQVQLHELGEWLFKCKGNRVVIDATSMTVAELYLLSKGLFSLEINDFEVIYVEPKEYTKTENDFMLSDSGIGFSGAGVPSLAIPHDSDAKNHVVFLLGYEGDRFADAMEVMQLESEQISLFFGVPSYKLNWEKNSYLGNMKVIEENRLNDRFIFCGANNPVAVSREIAKIKKSYLDSQLFIAPIGTKPQAIGCIPTICTSGEEMPVGVLWDHPKRKHGRTKGVAKILLTKKIFG